MVHTRAGLPAYTMADFAGADAFLEAVLTERGHELWFEGVRRSDLIRYGRYIEYARKIQTVAHSTGLYDPDAAAAKCNRRE